VTIVQVTVGLAAVGLAAAVAAPVATRRYARANEQAARLRVEALSESLQRHHTGQGRFPGHEEWARLFGPDEALAGSRQPSDSQASRTARGYVYEYTPLSDGAYRLTAVPLAAQRTGGRSFYVDESGRSRHCWCRAAGKCPPPSPRSEPCEGPAHDCG